MDCWEIWSYSDMEKIGPELRSTLSKNVLQSRVANCSGVLPRLTRSSNYLFISNFPSPTTPVPSRMPWLCQQNREQWHPFPSRTCWGYEGLIWGLLLTHGKSMAHPWGVGVPQVENLRTIRMTIWLKWIKAFHLADCSRRSYDQMAKWIRVRGSPRKFHLLLSLIYLMLSYSAPKLQ